MTDHTYEGPIEEGLEFEQWYSEGRPLPKEQWHKVLILGFMPPVVQFRLWVGPAHNPSPATIDTWQDEKTFRKHYRPRK